MSTLIDSFNFFKNSDKLGIILYDTAQSKMKTYKEIYEVAEKLVVKLANILTNTRYKCIGLMMEKNVHLPSIILSLHQLKYAFTYVSLNNLNESTEDFHIEYILSFENFNNKSYKNILEIDLDNSETLIIWKNLTIQENLFSQNDIFCIMKSSGTTGKNKSIAIPYSCIESNTLSLSKIFNVKSSDVIFWGTPLSFDPSLIEMLMGFLNGATVAIVTHYIYINPRALFEILFNISHITILQMVPSVFLRWNDFIIEKILSNTSLRILALGGEAFPKSLLTFNIQDDLRLFNLYGITELSCWATVHEIKHENIEDDIPIGTCLDDIIIKVYDENNLELSNGEGAAYIGSETRKCYIDDEFHKNDVPNLRETGDIVLIQNGQIYYKGRRDKVVKRFGHKVNLITIEETIFTHCGLVSKCVWSNKYKKILTFVLLKESPSKDVKFRILEKIRNKLLHLLSEISFPDYFEILQNFPVTAHGKVDEKKLETFYAMSLGVLQCDTSKTFSNLWCKYLGINTNNLDFFQNNTFFESGGNSITALQLIQEFKERTHTEHVDELTVALLTETFCYCEEIVGKFCKNISQKSKGEKIEAILENKRLKIDSNQFSVLWKHDLKACIDASPLIFKDRNNNMRIAVGSFCNIFAVLDENGKELFKEVLSGSIESTPTLSPCKKYLFIGCFDGTFHCIDFKEKRRIWELKTTDRIKSTPIFSNDGTMIFVGSYDKHVYSLLAENGSQCWITEVNGSVCSNILLDDYGLFVTTTQGSCYCITECNGDVKWKYNCQSPIFGTPCLLSQYQQILIPSVLGVIFCLSSTTGNLIWKYETNSNIFSSLRYYQDTVVFGSHDKHIYILELSAETYTSIRRFLTDCEISSTPFIFESNNVTMLVGISNNGTICLIDFKTLALLKKYSLPGEVFSSPIIYENNLFVGCRDNNLYCLSF